MNLVVNARDAMPSGGCLTIETQNVELDAGYAREHAEVKPGPYALIAVADTGHGMDANTKAHIFEPFFTTKQVGKGTGLGLATVFGIVKQSEGHIEVSSEPGHGATFRVYLPRLRTVAAEGRPATGTIQVAGGTETILLAEDEEGVRRLVRTVLESYGYQVVEAQNGREALAVSLRHLGTIHLLVTDVVMPMMSGRDLAHRLLQQRPNLRVLYMSGYTEEAIIRHGVAAAGTALVQKPFSPTALARKIREVLDAGKT
jgi:CheY-like chemotaxis protein